ncbi:hypothetical protein C8R47DRAFT_1070460 [Mycena vitilis]|nr:hypothetical protein C8R47DRAFT_1070460 [Mycena vitilis]
MTDSWPTRSSSFSSTSAELDELRKHTAYLCGGLCSSRRPLIHSRRKRKLEKQRLAQEAQEARQTKRDSQATKRCQWKAASARYYENHPEVRERKRLKMAEQRAAKRLARRKWDPPKKSRPAVAVRTTVECNEGVDVSHGRRPRSRLQVWCAASALEGNPTLDGPDMEDVHEAAESLLSLQRRAAFLQRQAAFPDDLPPSDEILTSEYIVEIYIGLS